MVTEGTEPVGSVIWKKVMVQVEEYLGQLDKYTGRDRHGRNSIPFLAGALDG